MAINTLHPDYDFRKEDWCEVRDCLAGERAIKAQSQKYLPVPPGMSPGRGEVLEGGKRTTTARYQFYLGFAEFPDLVAPVLNGFQGIVHGQLPKVELPENLKYLELDATPEKETLAVAWERTTRDILSLSRIGWLGDISSDDKVRMVGYSAENIINWRRLPSRLGGGPSLVVLREIQQRPKSDDPYSLEEVTLYRELLLDEQGIYRTQLWQQEKNGEPEKVGGLVTPVMFGKPLNYIPIKIINVTETGFNYEGIPIMPLVKRALAIYRRTADYNRSLYIKGDPQVVISGITPEQAPDHIGGDTIWTLPNPQARAQYLDIDGQGIPLMREAIKDEYERFYQEGGQLLDTADRSAESGEALRRRQVAKQVSLRTVAMNAGEGFDEVLKMIARIMGEDPQAVKFQPDLDFSEPQMSGQDLLELVMAKNQGGPLSDRTIHDNMRRGRLTALSYEEEVEAMKENQFAGGLELLAKPTTATNADGQ